MCISEYRLCSCAELETVVRLVLCLHFDFGRRTMSRQSVSQGKERERERKGEEKTLLVDKHH